ncbi:MAG TPA: metal ABC transporter substrate-binding protein, partial [Chloroflexota bacterium]|nr:metal ABC transporter substrate-binding protein [Chloroflexota bacterium]
MRRLGRFQALSGLMVGLALLLVPVGTVETRAQPDTRLQVVTSEAIFVDMIQHVGGDLVDAFNLVPPGADVEIYRPTPLDLLRASRARVAIWNGLSVDELIARDVSTLNIPDLLTVTLTEGLPVISSGDADEEEGGNPHMWLDPTLAMRYVDQIRDVLTAADPANAATYQANARRYSAEIADLDVWALQQVATIPPRNRKLVTFEDAFPYMARHFGLEIVGFVVTGHEREQSAQELAELVNKLKSQQIPTVFTGPQFDARILELAARDAGVQVKQLYSDTLDDQVNSYLALMRYNVN